MVLNWIWFEANILTEVVFKLQLAQWYGFPRSNFVRQPYFKHIFVLVKKFWGPFYACNIKTVATPALI